MNAITLKPFAVSAGTLRIVPLQPEIGAEVSGLDLREALSKEQRDDIKAALLRHKVLFFRDQPIDAEQQADFARSFGPLYTHPSVARANAIPALHKIAAVDHKTYEKDHAAHQAVWDPYHTDTSWRLVPTWGAVLRAVDLPDVGGDTIWVSGSLAYAALPVAIQERLDGLHVTHDFRAALSRAGHDYPIVAHPVVRVHRETGEKILWVNFSQNPHIVGLDLAESCDLLTRILDAYRRPENQVRFSWRPGSLAFWDNRAAVHYAVRNYGDYARVLERVLIADEPLYADL